MKIAATNPPPLRLNSLLQLSLCFLFFFFFFQWSFLLCLNDIAQIWHVTSQMRGRNHKIHPTKNGFFTLLLNSPSSSKVAPELTKKISRHSTRQKKTTFKQKLIKQKAVQQLEAPRLYTHLFTCTNTKKNSEKPGRSHIDQSSIVKTSFKQHNTRKFSGHKRN